MDAFADHPKLLSWLLLLVFGLPTLKGVILSSWSSDSEALVSKFLSETGGTRLLLRSDKPMETGSYPRGGYLVSREGLREECEKFFRLDRTVYLVEPISPFDDLYSLSLGFAESEITAEIVGPGFDASDLKRGDENPHEIATFLLEGGGVAQQVSHEIVDDVAYRESWKRRLNKVARLFEIDVDQENWFEQTRLVLEEKRELLLLEAEAAYSPIPRQLLASAIKESRELVHRLQDGGYINDRLVISLSFVSREARPVFWDIVWPGGKYVSSR